MARPYRICGLRPPHPAIPCRPLACLALLLALLCAAPAAWAAAHLPAYVDAQRDVLSFMNAYSADGQTWYLPTKGQSRTVGDLNVVAGPGDGNLWRATDGGASKVLLSTFARYDGYTTGNYGNGGAALVKDVWVTLVPELETHLRAAFPQGVDAAPDAVTLRAEQLLGMPNATGNDRVVELFVDPSGGSVANASLFRPAMNTDPSRQVTDAAAWTTPTTWQQHWVVENSTSNFVTWGNDPYPWTGLGYTYDWGDAAFPHQGLSEYIAPGVNASATVSGVTSIGSYLYATRAATGDYAGELDGSFRITGTADTVWGRAEFFRRLSDNADAAASIEILPAGQVTKGLLLDSADYAVRNAGVVAAPAAGRMPWSSSKDLTAAEAVIAVLNNRQRVMTTDIVNSGVLGGAGIGLDYLLLVRGAAGDVVSLRNTGVLYSGAVGLAHTSGAGEILTVDNAGILVSGTVPQAMPSGGAVLLRNAGQYVSQGALALQGDALFTSGSVYTALPQAGALTVSGTVDIAAGARLDVVTASLGRSAARSQTLIQSGTFSGGLFAVPQSGVIRYRQTVADTLYQVETARVAGYAAAARPRTGNAWRLSAALDALPGVTVNPDMLALVESLDDLTAGELNRALSSLHAEPYALSLLGSVNLADQFVAALPVWARSGAASGVAGAVGQGWQVWAAPTGGEASQQRHSGWLGYSQSFAGLATGLERHWTHGCLGLALGGYASRLHTRGVNAKDDITSVHTALYGGWHDGPHRLGGYAGYADARHLLRRDVERGDHSARADATFHDRVFTAGLRYGYRWRLGRWELTPSVGLRYTFVHRPGVAESGADGANLDMDETVYQMAELPVGLDLGTVWTTSGGLELRPVLHLAVAPRLGDPYAEVDARFKTAKGAGTFASRSREDGAWSVEAGLALHAVFSENVSAFVSYDFRGHDLQQVHYGQLGLLWRF